MLANMDNLTFMSEQVIRLYRRIARDQRFRGTNAKDCIKRLNNLKKSEDEYMFAYLDKVDVIFNSTMFYEIPVLAKLIIHSLLHVDPFSKESKDAMQLIDFLDCFECIENS